MQLNDARREKDIVRLHKKDEEMFEEFKSISRTVYVGLFEIKEDREKGFYLVATDFIEKMTIVSEYVVK